MPLQGTPYFMPTEILFKEYLFDPEPQVSTAENRYADEDSGETTRPMREPAIHHFHHDLESLWWLILWLITSYVQDQPAESWKDSESQAKAINTCRVWITPIFQNVLKLSAERHLCFTRSIKEKLGEILPKSLADHAWRIERLRKDLHAAMIDCVKRNHIRDHEYYAQLHQDASMFFDELQKSLKKDWRGYSLKTLEPAPETKPSIEGE